MDNVTHTLTGLMLSRAGLNRYFARPALLLILAANAPDIDVITATGGALTYFRYHRWITHAIVMAPAMAVLPVLVACAVRRSWKGWRAAYLLSIIGVASHLLLDYTNAYGIRLLLPFSPEWLRLDLTNVVDLWIWGVLFIAAVGPMLGRLVSSEIGAKPGTGRGIAIFALCFLLVYNYGRFLLHHRAIEVLNSRMYQGQVPIQVAAFPVGVANPLHWVGWVQGSNFSIRYALNPVAEFDPAAGSIFYDPEPSPAIEAARQTFAFQALLNFAQYPLWRVTPIPEPEDGKRVEVSDWRFSFTASAIVDRQNHVLRSWFHF
jgi:inner membrane protein